MECLKIKSKKLNKYELMSLSKEALIERITCLEAHNTQLQNIISKNNSSMNINNTEQKIPQKLFNFSKANFRHILLKFYYLGWDYQGFATQEDSINTIEYHLFKALTKTCLISERAQSNYHRCGRTDKGVSAFSQVISINVRTQLTPEQFDNNDKELKYCHMLNKVLPEDIRCVCWCPVEQTFSARFDCNTRSYKYFFPKAHFNINAMKLALNYLIGAHDFRNLCKMDVANGVVHYVRNIRSANIQLCYSSSSMGIDSPYDLYELTIEGQSFLWHQIRCIVGVLFLIGENKESPEIMQQLLDIETNPRKPIYNLANEIPLILYDCNYEGRTDWIFDLNALYSTIGTLQKIWTISSIKTVMMKSMLTDLERKYEETKKESASHEQLALCLTQGVRSKIYKPLMMRHKAEALENRIKHYAKKGKLSIKDLNSSS